MKCGLSRAKLGGFTLIELLVVISIISLLSSILLASLSVAKKKATAAAVKSNLINARTQAAFFYANNSGYGPLCNPSDPTFRKYLLAAGGLTGAVIDPSLAATSTYNVVMCHSSDSQWAVSAPLPGSTSAVPKMFCVDWNNTAKETSNVLGSNITTCP